MNSKVVFGQYYNADSWIHRLDPRTKIISIVLLIVGVFILQNLYLLLISLGLTLIIILSSKVPIGKFLKSLKMMTSLLLITVVFQLLFNRGQTVLAEFSFSLNVLNLGISLVLLILYFLSKRVIRKYRMLLFLIIVLISFYLQTILRISPLIVNYDIRFYEDGLMTSIVIVTRIVSLILISSLMTLTTKPTELNVGLEKLGKPLKVIGIKVSIITMMISIALRFIPTLINEAGKILKAQASRGIDFKEGKFSEKVTQIISLLVPMFVISYKRAYDLADAMEARGYIPEGDRTSISLIKFKFIDYLTLLVVLLVVASIITFAIIGPNLGYAI
jgi:energy-coupling factor transport system permease protein